MWSHSADGETLVVRYKSRLPAYRVFSSALEANGIVKALRIPDGQRISNARVKPKGDISGETAVFNQAHPLVLIHCTGSISDIVSGP